MPNVNRNMRSYQRTSIPPDIIPPRWTPRREGQEGHNAQIQDRRSEYAYEYLHDWIARMPGPVQNEFMQILATLSSGAYGQRGMGNTQSRFLQFLERVAEQGPPSRPSDFRGIPLQTFYGNTALTHYAEELEVSVEAARPVLESRLLKALEEENWEEILEREFLDVFTLNFFLPTYEGRRHFAINIGRDLMRDFVSRQRRRNRGVHWEETVRDSLGTFARAARENVRTLREATRQQAAIIPKGTDWSIPYTRPSTTRRSFMINLEQEGFKIKCKLGNRNEADDSQRELEFKLTRGWGRNAQSGSFTTTTGFPITKDNLLKLSEELKKLAENF